jgi:hypothetical protein
MACDILGANCNTNKTFIGFEDLKAEVKNVKSNTEEAMRNNNVTADQKDQINAAMLKYDCNYVDILHHPNVTVLYSFGIEKMLKSCEGLAQTEDRSDREFDGSWETICCNSEE